MARRPTSLIAVWLAELPDKCKRLNDPHGFAIGRQRADLNQIGSGLGFQIDSYQGVPLLVTPVAIESNSVSSKGSVYSLNGLSGFDAEAKYVPRK